MAAAFSSAVSRFLPKDNDNETLLTVFKGQVLICKCAEDAAIVRFAERVLNGEAAAPAELRDAIKVLLRYGCEGAAEALERKYARARAALYLAESTGYQRPNAIRLTS